MSKDRFITEEAEGFYLVEEEEATHETPDTQGTITEHTEEQ